MTVAHLRFGSQPIRSSYLIDKTNFIGCHQFPFLERMDVLSRAVPGASVLLNVPFAPAEVWNRLPRKFQEQVIEKRLRVFVIDAYAVARDTGMGRRINTIMQTCFFAISGILPRRRAPTCRRSELGLSQVAASWLGHGLWFNGISLSSAYVERAMAVKPQR